MLILFHTMLHVINQLITVEPRYTEPRYTEFSLYRSRHLPSLFLILNLIVITKFDSKPRYSVTEVPSAGFLCKLLVAL